MVSCRLAVIALLATVAISVHGEDPPVKDAAEAQVSPAEKLRRIKCEVAVNDASSAVLLVEKKLEDEALPAKEAADQYKLAQEAFNKAEREASREEMIKFGERFAELKAELVAVKKKNELDMETKIQYMNLRKSLPLLQKKLVINQSKIRIEKGQLDAMKQSSTELSTQLKASKKMNYVLRKQWPIKKELIDSQYARDIISANSRVASLKSKSMKLEKALAGDEKEIATFAQTFAGASGKQKVLAGTLKRLTADVQQTRKRIVANMRKTGATASDLEVTIQAEKSLLAANRAQGAEASMQEVRASKKDDAAAAAKLDAQKLAAEKGGEKRIEKAEEQGKSQAEILAEKQHDRLTADLNALTQQSNKRRAAQEERAARQVESVKQLYRKKLEAEKAANGEKV